MCSYRSLFTFINFKLLQRSLKEMQRMSYDLTAGAVDSNGEQLAESNFEYEIDIN